MSNALWTASILEALAGAGSTRAASQAVDGSESDGSAFMIGVLALGLLVLAPIVVRFVARPRSLTLQGTPGRPNRLHFLHLVGILVAWVLLQVLLLGLAQIIFQVNLKDLGEMKPPPLIYFQVMVVVSLVAPLWMAGASLVIGALTFRGGLRRGMGLSMRHWIWDGGCGLVSFLAVLPVCIGVLMLSNFLLRNHEDLIQKHFLLTALQTMPTGWKAGIFVAAGILAPLGEELFFRGLMQSTIRQVSRSPWAAILITAPVFALMHMQEANAIPSLLVLAIVLGYLYERSGRLVAPMVLHGLFNMANMISVLGGAQ